MSEPLTRLKFVEAKAQLDAMTSHQEDLVAKIRYIHLPREGTEAFRRRVEAEGERCLHDEHAYEWHGMAVRFVAGLRDVGILFDRLGDLIGTVDCKKL